MVVIVIVIVIVKAIKTIRAEVLLKAIKLKGSK